MNRKYTVIVNFECKQYVENIYASNMREANSIASNKASAITHGGHIWLQSYCAKQGWRGNKLGVVHDPRIKEEEPEFPISDKEFQVLNLIEQDVSEEAAMFIVYGPASDNEHCPDLE
jgi:hypothetical protein